MPEWQPVKTPKSHLVFASCSTKCNRESGWPCVEGDGLSRGLLYMAYIWSQYSTTDKISCTYSCIISRELHLIQ